MKPVHVAWFEIPTADLDRAISFYQTVFDCKLEKLDMGEFKMAMFPSDHTSHGAGGSLVYHHDFYECSSSAGTLVYFHSEDCETELARVEKAGGSILIPKQQISPEYGYMAVFLDSEGNRVALHSQS
ncbi:VOC family protein [Algoriphagus namhaensis]